MNSMDGLNQGLSMFKDVLPVNFKSIFALICKAPGHKPPGSDLAITHFIEQDMVSSLKSWAGRVKLSCRSLFLFRFSFPLYPPKLFWQMKKFVLPEPHSSKDSRKGVCYPLS
jgi:hypothetical protein